MAWPKKGTRPITVNNITYRWTVKPDSGYIKLIVVREPQTGQRLATIFPYRLMVIPLIIPSVVRSVILLALEQGWQPTERGLKEFCIFDVDKQAIPSFEIIGKKIYAAYSSS
ncbi:hypothetical protein IQ274_04820 [Nostoc sp. LEGE 12447]|uniref:hypothetical protein n=1 Tax=Nostoc sp. LEGE 12447 TaxID=1828640 RepID=UPI0018839328|nr:hypothetical protein [Nostoc sp. LEGE 12447]MBE8997554.1 hypothetical protein [Nostoc sp. LEGE 12447]